MSDETSKIRWHYGFYAAMKVQYAREVPLSEFRQEIQLGEEPVRLDMAITTEGPLSDPLGQGFRKRNIFEYKSPDDGLSIDDFYKAQAYSLIYKGYDQKVNAIPIGDMSLTMVRHAKPEQMMKDLEKDGYTVSERYPGIYDVTGPLPVKTQVVVTRLLPPGEYEGLKLLSEDATQDAVTRYLKDAEDSGDTVIMSNAGSVIYYCLQINPELVDKLKEVGITVETVKEVFKQAFEEERAWAWDGGKAEGKEEVAAEMIKENYSTGDILRLTKLPYERVAAIAKSLGVEALAV